MIQFTPFVSRFVSLPLDNIDTDQIIPARYLKGTGKHGLGEVLFADLRGYPDGTPRPDFVLNRPEAAGAQILLAGSNFGCGSSREHAAWALTGHGFRAVISTSFADIFCGNALKNGLLPITVRPEERQMLVALAADMPGAELRVDLGAQTVSLPDGQSISFPVDPFSKSCLIKGVDELGYILSFADRITSYERKSRGL